MTFDSRWKNPQGADPRQQHLWAQDVVRELRKGFGAAKVAFDNATSGLAADTVQEASDEVEGRVDFLEANGIVTIASGTLSGGEVELLNIPQTFAMLELRVTGMSFDSAARSAVLQVSTDNGATYDTTAGNYSFFSATGGAVATASLISPVTHTLAADVSDHSATITGYRAGAYPKGYGFVRIGAGFDIGWATYFGATTAIDALRFLASAGNFDAGAYALYGVR